MAESLFPVFDLPDVPEDEEEKYFPSVYFDFKQGDFVLDGAHRMIQADGREAYRQWCLKMVDTEREACLAYSGDLGTEFEGIGGSREVVESDIEETITDALMMHPCTEYVSDFEFEHAGDSCWVKFVVKGYGYDEETLSVEVPVR